LFLVAIFFTAVLPLPAQNKLVPPGERAIRPRGAHTRVAEHKAQSFDAGDFYVTPEGKRQLHRLAGAVVVQVNEPLDKAATVKTLAGS
jgi:hypothetical protein